MDLAPGGIERTTAGTDALLAIAAAAGIVLLRRYAPPSFGRAVWQGALGALVVASALGSVTHGLVLSEPTRYLLWQPLYLALGVMMALFVVGAIRDWRGDAIGRRALAPMLVLAVVFYGITRLTGGDFLAFVVYEAGALLFSLAVYLKLASAERRPGATAMAAALAVSLAAGALQAVDPGPIRLIWVFDHNGLFHLVQLFGLALMVAGLRRLLADAAVPRNP
jgi:hypothetical protein